MSYAIEIDLQGGRLGVIPGRGKSLRGLTAGQARKLAHDIWSAAGTLEHRRERDEARAGKAARAAIDAARARTQGTA